MLSFYASADTPEENRLISRLYAEHKLMMYKIAFAVLKNSFDAEDAVHDAFINIIRKGGLSKIKSFDKQAERAYIMTVVKNAAVKLYNLRKKTAAENIEDIYSLKSGDTPEEELFAGYDAECVGKAMLKLSPNDYEILFLSLVNELSNQELAEHFDITEDAVRQRIRRAKDRLKKLLEKEEIRL